MTHNAENDGAVRPGPQAATHADRGQPNIALQTCNCHSGMTPAPSPTPHRRLFMRAVSAAFLVPALPAMAQDDLLDPSKLTSKNKPGNAPVDASERQTPAADKVAVAPRTANDARAMASSVVGHMDNLTRALSLHIDEVAKLDKRARELVALLAKLSAEKQAKLDEYRAGLFCSGCGKTKSEILAAGQNFPHDGQTIIQATEAQIDAKDKEMHAPIDRYKRELKENRTRRNKVAAEQEEIILQIQAGLALWQTSISFEHNLIAKMELDSAQRHREARKKIEAALSKTKPSPKQKNSASVAQQDIELKRVDAQRQKEKGMFAGAAAKARSAAEEELNALNGYFGRSGISQILSIVATISHLSPTAGFNDLGGTFRMGQYSVSGHDEVLPAVQAFIAAFRSLPANAQPAPAPLPAQGAPATDSMRRILKDLLKCKPEDGDQCDTPRRDGGSGVRG
jgi:hypothetical protein